VPVLGACAHDYLHQNCTCLTCLIPRTLPLGAKITSDKKLNLNTHYCQCFKTSTLARILLVNFVSHVIADLLSHIRNLQLPLKFCLLAAKRDSVSLPLKFSVT